jgi:cob(I)alamin adenosyltransferase
VHPRHAAIFDADIERLEQHLDAFNEPLPALKDFILPGWRRGRFALPTSRRTVVAAPNARTVSLSRHEAVRPGSDPLLNRLSDLLFVLARVLARSSGHGEVLWNHERRKGRRQSV